MTLMHDLIAAIGKDAVSDDPAARAVMSNDVYRGAGVPALIVRPTTVEALQAAVRVCAAAGVATAAIAVPASNNATAGLFIVCIIFPPKTCYRCNLIVFICVEALPTRQPAMHADAT